MGIEDDARRVREVRGGNLEAFGELYDSYAPLIRAICHHEAGGDLPRSLDLCQEVFLRAYRNLSALREPENFAGWLVGIARMVCREGRRKRLYDRRLFVSESCDQVTTTPQEASKEELDGVLAAIRELPEPERMALDLFYLQENSVEVARQVLKLSRSGFYLLLERAVQTVRRRMGQGMEVKP